MKKTISFISLAMFCIFQMFSQGIIINHTCTKITQIPESAIQSAKQNLHIAYAHTSHGSQLTDGMGDLIAFMNGKGYTNNLYSFNNGGTGGALDLHNGAMEGDVGYYPDWVNNTRNFLGAPNALTGRGTGANADINVIIWSWCGQVTGKYQGGTLYSEYINPMVQLETDYFGIKFVYMTGHLDYGQDADNKAANKVIRDFCVANNKILYDFSDIESYDPDDKYFQFAGDDCSYYSASGVRLGNWATEWQNSHTVNVDWYNCGSAHSEPLNANQKAYAAWWLWARLSGWDGGLGGNDTEAPSTPNNLRSSNIHDIGCTLQWDASTDNVNVTGYQVYQGTSLIGTSRTTTFSVTGLTPNTNYSFTVYARDFDGNISNVSNQVSITTLNNLPTTNLAIGKVITASSTESQYYPSTSANDGNAETRWSSAFADPQWLSIDLGMVYTISRVVLIWEDAENYGRSYQIQVSDNGTDWSNIYSTTSGIGGTENLTGLSGTGRYIRFYGTQRSLPYGFSLREIEVYGIVGNGTADTEAPTSPTNLLSSSLSSTTVNLSWNASTDNIGVTGYNVYRDTSFIGTATATSYNVSGLSSNQSYTFTVYAKDAAGNISDTSNILLVTTIATSIQSSNEGLKIYPNPTHDNINFENINSVSIISIYDINGILQLQNNAANNLNQIDVSKLSTGIYIIKISYDSGVVIEKFVKE